ncbi:MAG: hypothetical protein AB7U75_14325 [Hyphomicrobiaceae bacterium]
MPIIFYNTRDEVPADFADVATEVTEDGDNKGKFSVNVVSRKKLDEFRTNNTKLAAEMEELKSKYKDIVTATGAKGVDEFDLDGFKETLKGLKETSQKVADGKIKGTDDIEKAVAERMEIARAKLDDQLKESAQREAALKAERDKAVADYKRTFIDRAVASAFTDPDLGVEPTALGDVMQKAYGVFVVEEDGGLTPKKNGQTLWGEDGTTPRSVKEWITVDLRKESPHYFKKSNGGGANGGGDTKQFGGLTEAEFNALPARKRLEIANQQKFQASGTR